MDNNSPEQPQSAELELAKIKNDRLKLIFDFLKFIGGTGLVGVVTLLVNADIQKRQLEQEMLDKENQFIQSMLQNMRTNTFEERKIVSEAFSILLPDGKRDPSMRWKEYAAYLDKRIEIREKKKQELEAKNREQEAKLAEAEETKKEVERLKQQLAEVNDSSKKQELKLAYQGKVDELLKVNDDLYKIRSDIDTKQQQIQKDEQLQAQLDDIEQIQVVDDSDVVTSGESLWTYVGTFRNGEFNKDINFDVLNIPEVNQRIKAINDVNMRSREPRWTFLRGWTMGTIQDVIKKDMEFMVDAIERVPAKGGGHRIWVRGKKVSS